MLVRFIRGTALGGVGNDAKPGDLRELTEAQALRFMAEGRALVAATTDTAESTATSDAPPRHTSRKKAN